MRLQKYMALSGVASRRKSEEIIESGRVTVNGEIVDELGTKIDPDIDVIEVDGKPVGFEKKVYIKFYKPPHVISALKDPQGRTTIKQYFKGVDARIYNIGRLDYDSEGILLMTNDGRLANTLMHPSFEVPKTYYVVCRGHLNAQAVARLKKGVEIDGKTTAKAEVEVVEKMRSTTRVRITITEGMNRQVRRMFEEVGHYVSYLKREEFAGITLEGLTPGKWKYLESSEVNELKRLGNLK